jgi:phage terminase large subunit-like protein
MTEEAPDPARILRLARQTMSSAELRKKYTMLDFWGPSRWYRTQLEFFAGGSSGVHQRMLSGGNQTGKTLCGAAEVSWHATGLYPDWWTGHRFKKPLRIWCVAESLVLLRDAVQRKLLGDIAAGELGMGSIPLDALATGKKIIMVSGGGQMVDTVFVRHYDASGKPDGLTSMSCKTFEQRREKLQSESVDLIWIDEKPSMDIYSELLARTIATDGHIILTYTSVGPGAAAGVTELFLSQSSPDRAAFCITEEELAHVSPERRQEMEEQLPPHERDARMRGVPQMGTGSVFPLTLVNDAVKRIDRHAWDGTSGMPPDAVLLLGVDFGYDHPFAAGYCAWSPSIQHFYVLDSFAMPRAGVRQHVDRILAMTGGLCVPTAYPHDGGQHDKGSGIALKKQYADYGLLMMAAHATNHGTGGIQVEPPLSEMLDAFRAGKITIDVCNRELIDELMNYHRDEQLRLVKARDDLISALRYAWMMRRHGKHMDSLRGIGYGPGPYARYVPRDGGRRETQFARGTPNHPDGSFDVFSGR